MGPIRPEVKTNRLVRKDWTLIWLRRITTGFKDSNRLLFPATGRIHHLLPLKSFPINYLPGS
jgi:hypothetical protein